MSYKIEVKETSVRVIDVPSFPHYRVDTNVACKFYCIVGDLDVLSVYNSLYGNYSIIRRDSDMNEPFSKGTQECTPQEFWDAYNAVNAKVMSGALDLIAANFEPTQVEEGYDLPFAQDVAQHLDSLKIRTDE